MESESLSAALRVVAAVLVGVPLLAYLLQEKLIFFPQPLSAAQIDASAGRAAKSKSLYVTAADGTRLHAWYVEPPPGAPLVVYFGGNAEGVSWMLGEVGREVPRAGWLLIDYRGYGGSRGPPPAGPLTPGSLPPVDAPPLDWRSIAGFLDERPS